MNAAVSTPRARFDAMKGADIAKIRRDSLRRLTEKQGGPTTLGKVLGYASASYVSQMISGKKPITEKTARFIEEKLGLERYALDLPDGTGAGHGRHVSEAPPRDYISPPKSMGNLDRKLFINVHTAVGEELEKIGIPPGHDKYPHLISRITADVYESSVPIGRVDRDLLTRLLDLLG